MFLYSMVNDLLKMSDDEIPRFKQKSLQAIDDILSNRLEFTSSHVYSSSSTPSTISEIIFIPHTQNIQESTTKECTDNFYEIINETLSEIEVDHNSQTGTQQSKFSI